MALQAGTLNNAANIFARYRGEVTKILQQYREDISLCNTRFSGDFAAEQRRTALSEAQGRIRQADKELSDKIHELTKESRSELFYEAVRLPIIAVRDALAFYQQFDIAMTETDVRACAESTKGNYIAMKALQGLAAKNGFRVTCPSLEEVDADLKRIEKAARVPNMYAPAEYYAEAAEVMGKIPMFRTDGSVASYGNKPNAVYFSIIEKAHTDLENALRQEMPQRWQNFHTVSVDAMPKEQAAAEADNAGQAQPAAETVDEIAAPKVSVDSAYEAAALASENAASEARSRDILLHYTKR